MLIATEGFPALQLDNKPQIVFVGGMSYTLDTVKKKKKQSYSYGKEETKKAFKDAYVENFANNWKTN